MKFSTQVCIIHTLVGSENGLYRLTGYGTFHISQIGIVGSWAQRRIHTKLDTSACILTLNASTKNYLDWFTRSGTFHISQIGILGS